MTVPGDVSAAKLAGDYLTDLTQVALRYLPKGDRLKFIGRTKALIERRCGPLTDADPDRVAALLAELGTPRELVMRERERLDQAWAKRRPAARSAGASPAAPWDQRPLTSRWRPATGDRMRPPRGGGRLLGGRRARQDPAGGPVPAADADAAADAAPAHAPPPWPGSPPAADEARTAGRETAGPETAGPETAGPETAGPETAGPETAGPETAGPETAGAETGEPGPGEAVAGQDARGESAAAEAGGPGPGEAVAAEDARAEPAGDRPGAADRPAPGEGAGGEPAAAAGAAADRVSPDAAPGEWTPPVPAGEWAARAAAGQPLAGGAADPGRDVAGDGQADRPGRAAGGELVPRLSAIEPTSVVPPERPPLPPVPPGAVAPGPPTIPGLTLADDAGSELVPARPAGALAPLTPAGLATLARGHRREALAVILLGVGGLLLPLPFWPLGAAVAGFSRFWEARYRWVSLYGPALVTLVLTVPLAAIAGGHGNVVSIYLHMIWVDARYLVRVGCVLTAAYLTWLVRRGRRERVPPWRR